MEIFGRNTLFKVMLISIALYPVVPEEHTSLIGVFMGLFFALHLYVDKDAFKKIRRGRKQNKLAYGLAAFLFLLLQVLTLIYSKDPAESFRGILIYASAFVMFFVLKYALNRPNHTIPLVKTYFLSVVLVGVYHLGQVLFDEIVLGISFDPSMNFSFLENPATLAYFMLIPLFPALVLYIYKEQDHESRFYLFVLGIALISIFMSGSRIAVVGLFIGLGLLSLLYSMKFIVALIPTGVFLILIPVFSTRHGQFFTLSQEMNRAQFSMEVVRQNLSTIFIGRGFNTFDETFGRFMVGRPELLNLDLVNKPYNTILQVVMELGLIGLLLGAMVVIYKIRGIAAYTRSAKIQPAMKVMYVGVMVSMIVLIFVGLMDSYMLDPKIVYSISIIMGIMHGDANWKGINKI